jgi:hypothetical protein
LANPEIGALLFLSPRTLAESYADHVDWHQVAPIGTARLSPAAHPARRLLTAAQWVREMRMALNIAEQSLENQEYVRRLLKQKQPAFAAALELGVELVGRKLLAEARPGGPPAARYI